MLISALETAHLTRARCIVCGEDRPISTVETVYMVSNRNPLTRSPSHYCSNCRSGDSFEVITVTPDEYAQIYGSEE